mmetsp:Transcript_10289/g.34961  ORF Transcript_10289/g.34961 Transcript_10289/m.34961 type:complete len:244 (+) Transcript_10289:568-1299(+)
MPHDGRDAHGVRHGLHCGREVGGVPDDAPRLGLLLPAAHAARRAVVVVQDFVDGPLEEGHAPVHAGHPRKGLGQLAHAVEGVQERGRLEVPLGARLHGVAVQLHAPHELRGRVREVAVVLVQRHAVHRELDGGLVELPVLQEGGAAHLLQVKRGLLHHAGHVRGRVVRLVAVHPGKEARGLKLVLDGHERRGGHLTRAHRDGVELAVAHDEAAHDGPELHVAVGARVQEHLGQLALHHHELWR